MNGSSPSGERSPLESARGGTVGPPALPPFRPSSPRQALGRSRLPRFVCVVILLASMACARGSSQVRGWTATQPGMELRIEERAGPRGEPTLALLYTIVTGTDYAIERRTPIQGREGRPHLRLMAKATRVVHLAVVLVDKQGTEHESARTLVPGEWRELSFGDFQPPVDDWGYVAVVRLVDRTGGLGGQGPVSLKLVDLPL
jgi:hypothetical protein